MNFKITVLGTASALPTISRYPSAQVVELRGRSFLIDCGEGAQMQMKRYSVSFLKIEAIFISHMHGDHVFGIFGLLSTMSMAGRTSKLRIYAPAQFSTVLSFFKANFAEGLKYEIEHISLAGITSPEVIYDAKSFEVLSFPLNHRIASFGFLFREKVPPLNVIKEKIGEYSLSLYEIARLKEGSDVAREDGTVLKNEEFTYVPYLPSSYAYCSDTAPFEKLSDWISGVDLLYHEATFDESLSGMAAATYHSTARQAAECALKAGVGKLAIGHYSSRFKDLSHLLEEASQVFGNTVLSSEGMVFEIEQKKNVL